MKTAHIVRFSYLNYLIVRITLFNLPVLKPGFNNFVKKLSLGSGFFKILYNLRRYLQIVINCS